MQVIWSLASFAVALSSDIVKMLAELRQERKQVNEAIAVLERLLYNRGKRRGRPPAWMTMVKRRGKPPGSKNKPKEACRPLWVPRRHA